MAKAKSIDVDKAALTWIEIEDTTGARHKYFKRHPAGAGATLHVYQIDATSIQILSDGKDGCIIDQDGPGFPNPINVYLQPVNPAGAVSAFGMPVFGGWGGGLFAYELQN